MSLDTTLRPLESLERYTGDVGGWRNTEIYRAASQTESYTSFKNLSQYLYKNRYTLACRNRCGNEGDIPGSLQLYDQFLEENKTITMEADKEQIALRENLTKLKIIWVLLPIWGLLCARKYHYPDSIGGEQNERLEKLGSILDQHFRRHNLSTSFGEKISRSWLRVNQVVRCCDWSSKGIGVEDEACVQLYQGLRHKELPFSLRYYRVYPRW